MNSQGIKMQMDYMLDVITRSMDNHNDYADLNNLDNKFDNPLAYLKYLFDGWDNENERHYFPILQNRIADWLRGLPIGIDFTPYKMLQKRDEWGYTTKDDKWIDGWWNGCANTILKLAKKYKVDFYER